MPQTSWLDKYPWAKALLQRPNEVLDYPMRSEHPQVRSARLDALVYRATGVAVDDDPVVLTPEMLAAAVQYWHNAE